MFLELSIVVWFLSKILRFSAHTVFVKIVLSRSGSGPIRSDAAKDTMEFIDALQSKIAI